MAREAAAEEVEAPPRVAMLAMPSAMPSANSVGRRFAASEADRRVAVDEIVGTAVDSVELSPRLQAEVTPALSCVAVGKGSKSNSDGDGLLSSSRMGQMDR